MPCSSWGIGLMSVSKVMDGLILACLLVMSLREQSVVRKCDQDGPGEVCAFSFVVRMCDQDGPGEVSLCASVSS